MARLVTRAEQHPLIDIDWSQHGMRLHDLFQRQSVAGEKCFTQLRPRLLEFSPGGSSINLSPWTNLLRSFHFTRAIDDLFVRDGAGHRSRLRLWPEAVCASISDPFADAHPDSLVD